MAEDIVSIGIALDTSKVLAGTRQVDAALKSVATASTATAQATEKMDQASKAAGQALTAESKAAQAAAHAMGQQLATAVAAAAQAMIQAQREAKKADENLRKMAKAAEEAKKAADAAAQSFGQRLVASMGDFGRSVGAFALAQAGVMGLQAAFTTAKDALVDLVKTGISMQNLRTSFAAASGSAKAGAEDFRFVVKTANDLGLGLQSVAEQYRSLAAATRGTILQGAETREIFVTLSKAAQVYGLSNEQLGRAMTALQQIISKGKVSMEELRGQLGEALPGALQVAARAYGVTTQALETMIEKGVAGEEFARKWITQLGAELPAAAGRAGKGIQQLGNEIVQLKDSIAKSGLVAWIDTVSGKLAGLMRQTREIEEKAERGAARRAERGVGAETFEGLPAAAREQLAASQRRIADAEKDLADKERTQSAWTVLGIKSQTQVAKERLETLKQEDAALKARLVLHDAETKELARRQAKVAQGDKDQQTQVQTIDAENNKLKTTLDAVTKQQEDFAKAAALMPELYGKGNGTLKEQLMLLEQRNAVTKKGLADVAEQLTGRPAGAGPVPPELLARKTALQEQYRVETTAIESTKKAIQDLGDAERTREQDKKDAKAEEDRLKAETQRLDEQQNAEVARTHFQNIEQLRRMAAQYTEVKTARDADTASTLAASLATSQYNEEAQRQLTLIQDGTKALEDRRKVEEKVPKLREEAEASAAVLSDIQRLQKQLEPSKRRLSREEQLAATRAELAERSKGDVGTLARADEQIRETLDTELWDEWRDAGLDAMSDLSSALTDFVFTGKGSLTDLANHAVQQFFRMASEQTFRAIFNSDTTQGLLKAGLSLVGAVAGGGGSTGAFVGGDAPGMQHGGTAYAGHPYWVGEAGPELVVPKQTSTVIPHGQSMALAAPNVTVVVHGVTDASSFLQSQGAVQRGVARAITAAQRAM